LLDQISSPIASVTADAAYDREPIYRTIAEQDPAAAVIIPPRSTTVPSGGEDRTEPVAQAQIGIAMVKGRASNACG
jgi:hypothetical protein